MALLELQAQVRHAESRLHLGYVVTNDARRALNAQQVIVVERTARGGWQVKAVSSLTEVDQSSPLVSWFAQIVADLEGRFDIERGQQFEADAFETDFDDVQRSYPLRNLLWVPWRARGDAAVAGMLLARSAPWSESECVAANYLAGAFGHAWSAFDTRTHRTIVARLANRRSAAAVMAISLGLLLVPVPMTALAPTEVTPVDTLVVTSGTEGVVKTVEVNPNAPVKKGQLLVSLVDTVLRNRAEIADREVSVADTKYKRASQLAFVDARGRHEMALAKSDLDLKLAERDYARELLARSEIRSDRDGVAFFTDKKDLVGRPVAVGEKLMEIADPDAFEFRIDLPVADAIVVRESARVKVFLDSAPLAPIEARVVRAAYKAASREGQQLAFRLFAQVDGANKQQLRLGGRGTAQVYSDRVPLGFYLFRRPIAAARQWSGL